MRRKILAGMVVLLFMMTVVVPVVNGENVSKQSGKIYRNVLICGIGHNQEKVDADYRQPNGDWIIHGVRFDLVIAPYTGDKVRDFALAAKELCGNPVVSGRAFEPYKGALFENVITHSGGGPAFRNQRELGNIKTIPGHVTFLGDPATYADHKESGDTYVVNPGEHVALIQSLPVGLWHSSVQEGPGWGHSLKNYLPKEYVPNRFIVGGVDSGPGTGLGGIDFTSIRLNHISTYTYSDPIAQMQNFDFVLKAQKAEKGDEIINIEDATELSLNAFFVGLTLPESKYWVNLNPWEPNRTIDADLGKTDVGKIMLEADLQMKKDLSEYENPCESEIGEEYWKLLDKKSEGLTEECMRKHPCEIEDADNVLFSPVTRHWIVPDKTDVYESGGEMYIVDITLNIESEPVYAHSTYQIVNQKHSLLSEGCKEALSEAACEYGRYAMELEEEMILPLVVHEVNHGRNYSDLRQVYTSLTIAQWYKDNYYYSLGIFTDLIDSNDLAGLESKDTWSAEDIWRDYVRSFEEGEYQCWKNETKEETYLEGAYIVTRTIARAKLYSSGGVDFTAIKLTNIGDIPSNLKELTSEAIYAPFTNVENEYYFGDGLYLFYQTSAQPTIKHPSEYPKVEEIPKSNGFEAIFSIFGLLCVVYLIRLKKKGRLK